MANEVRGYQVTQLCRLLETTTLHLHEVNPLFINTFRELCTKHLFLYGCVAYMDVGKGREQERKL